MTHYHLATRYNVLLCYNRTRSDLLVVACAQPVVTFKPPKRGKLKFYWTIWSTLQKKKSMQHISGLWGTSWIYIDISTFLEKLFKVILFLIIPIDSIKYLVSYFFLLSAQPQSGKIFLRLLWKCKTQILIVLCSIYTQGCMIIKNGNYFYFMWRSRFRQTFMLKRTHKPNAGADGEEREIRQKAHKIRLQTRWMFSVFD